MRLHYLKHEKFEDLGCIRKWADEKKYSISCTKLYENEKLPKYTSFDVLIVLGGSMNVYEENKYPWLVKEKEFIKQVIAYGIPVLGVCLGAQLLSDVLGGVVTKNMYTEIGWFPVYKVAADNMLASLFPDNFSVFHWHGDTFSIPKGALSIFSSDGCINQAFVYNKNVVALQFHLETEIGSVSALCKNCADEIVEGKYIQNTETMQQLAIKNVAKANELMFKVLDYLTLN